MHEHIGEAQPVAADGSCADPFLLPNQEGTLCILPGRIDIGRHYILTGGPAGLREPYESLISRVQSFGRYVFSLDEYPEVAALFDAPRFVELARSICPAHKQHLDPFQFNLIVQLPGQTVAAHLDGVYFWGATRWLPQWLLAAMAFSGRFADRFVDQVRVVAYLQWGPATRRGGGRASFCIGRRARRSPSRRSRALAAQLMDLRRCTPPSSTSARTHRRRSLHRQVGGAPPRVRGRAGRRRRVGAAPRRRRRRWCSGTRPTTSARRSCTARFADAAEAALGGNGGPEAQMLALDGVLATLADELVRRKARSVEVALAMPRTLRSRSSTRLSRTRGRRRSSREPARRAGGREAGAAAASVVGAVLRLLCASVA